jgi:hypothetical protein
LRALKLRRREIRLSETSASQDRAFEVARAQRDSCGKGFDFCFTIEFCVVDGVKARQHEPV